MSTWTPSYTNVHTYAHTYAHLWVAIHSCNMSVQGITIENNTIYGDPAGIRAVSLSEAGKSGPDGVAFSTPPMRVWRWPDGPPLLTYPISNISAFPRGFLDDGFLLTAIQQVWM